MAILKIEQFGGMIPKLDEKKLPSNCAVDAINVDLQGTGIKPLYAPTLVRSDPVQTGRKTASVVQVPTACFQVTGGGSACYAKFTPPNGNYTVVAGDYLWYAVFLPAGSSLAGQGCIRINFSDATTLNASVNDQNGIAHMSGNIGAYAAGKWYLRRILLAGNTDSSGGAVTGKEIASIHLLQNHSTVGAKAYYGVAFIANYATAPLQITTIALFDPDRQQAPASDLSAGGQSCGYDVIDEDDAAYADFIAAGAFSGATTSVALAQLEGFPRQKRVFVESAYIEGPLSANMHGRANHDAFAATNDGWSAFYDTPHFAFQSNWRAISAYSYGVPASGWVGVSAPASALACNVTGGAASDITRSYVYTHVNEDGFESAPSPALVKTGKSDGTWTLTVSTWVGTDTFPDPVSGRAFHKRYLYRTTTGGETYKYLGELDDNDTSFVDAVADASLGEDIGTTAYLSIPRLTTLSTWINGMLGGAVYGTQVAFCEPYQYHAWPTAYRYTIPYFAVATGAVGDKFVVLTKKKPLFFSGSDPDNLSMTEVQTGEACIGLKGVLTTDVGVIYPGKTGWGLVDYGGYTNVTKEFLSATDYAAIVSADTVAAFDNRKLYWITQNGTTGYAFEFGAQERSLTKWEIPTTVIATVQAMSYYGPRNTVWAAGANASGYLGVFKLFADTSQKLKWTWKSKLLRTAAPVNFSVAQVESTEWDSLSVEMKNRDVFRTGLTSAWATSTAYIVNDLVTNGGNTYRCLTAHTSGTFATDLAALKWILNNSAYTITITGLTQAEAWCYLKVWADADKSTDKVLVYDDFVASDRPVVLSGGIMSDCWQLELRGNMAISAVAIAETERELNSE